MVAKVEKKPSVIPTGLNLAANGDVIRDADAGADRRTPPRPDQGGQGRGRKRPRGGAQYPPRRQQRLQNLLKDKSITEDEERRADDIQKLTDKYIVEVDKALAEKKRN